MNPDIQHLIDQLHDPDAEARVRAAAALGQFGASNEDTTGLDTYGVLALVEALGDSERDVRWEAAYALGALGYAAALHALIDAYERYADDSGLRLVIVKGLGKIAHPDAAPHLLGVLHHAPSLCLQTASAKALERVGTANALSAVAAWRQERN